MRVLVKRSRRAVAAAGLFGLTALSVGCAVGPDFVPPEVPVNDDWLESRDRRVSENSDPRLYWWKVFKDPTLDRLVEIASEENLSFQVTGLRILSRARNWAWPSASSSRRFSKAQAPRRKIF